MGDGGKPEVHLGSVPDINLVRPEKGAAEACYT